MSRIGKKPIVVPNGVTVKMDGQTFRAKGPKGELSYEIHPHIQVTEQDNLLIVTISDQENKDDRALWGTMRQIINNTVYGVASGYSKQLEIKGVGYKAETKGNVLILYVGYSHPVAFKLPEGIKATVEKNIITLESTNKEQLGETAANIRKVRKPEPYKGKGIRYVGEVVLRKAGKQVKTAAK